MRVLALLFVITTSYWFAKGQSTEVITFKESGLDCYWNPADSNSVVYSMKGEDKYYDLHISRPDGSGDTCLTCDHPQLPNRHQSNPAWHPSGKWIVFVVEKKVHPRSSAHALPGFGAYCDIWVISRDGKQAYKIVETPNDYDHGVIAPRFSPDGKKIVWTDRNKRPNFLSAKRAAGFWDIKTGDFSFDANGIPQVSNIKVITPGARSFYESYGFSPDSKRIVYCSSVNQVSFWSQQIYTCDTMGKNVTQLTFDKKSYNEHGCYSPDGKSIVWMSNKGNKNKGTDWWIMDTDGGNQRRLTFFNDPKHKQYNGKALWCGLISFSPSGRQFIGGVQKSLITQEGKIVIVTLK